MLVLTRKLNESIMIGEDIKVTLLGVDGDRAKIGIDAPAAMRIFRFEMLERTVEENKLAVNRSVDLGALCVLRQQHMHHITGGK